MRLDKLLGQAGFGSRNQVKKLIRSRQVYVDGRLAEADNLNVEPSLQEITVSGKQVTLSTEKYFILNKPSGVVSAVSDKEHQTVINLIAEADRVPKLYPVGRLDRDTEGLLLWSLGFSHASSKIPRYKDLLCRSKWSLSS